MTTVLACYVLFSQILLLRLVFGMVPQWPPTYQMNRSTIIMSCNESGYFSDEAVQKLSRFAIVDIDWSNAKLLWSNTSPMDDQQRLLTQAKAIKKANPSTYVWVYRLSLSSNQLCNDYEDKYIKKT